MERTCFVLLESAHWSPAAVVGSAPQLPCAWLKKALTLRGPNIASDFEALVIDYIEKRFGQKTAAE